MTTSRGAGPQSVRNALRDVGHGRSTGGRAGAALTAVLALGTGVAAEVSLPGGASAEDLLLADAAEARAEVWADVLEQAAKRDVGNVLLWSANIDRKSPSVRWMLDAAKRNFRGAVEPQSLRIDYVVFDVRHDAGLVRAEARLDMRVRFAGQSADSEGSEGRVLTFAPVEDDGRLRLVGDVADGVGEIGWWDNGPGR